MKLKPTILLIACLLALFSVMRLYWPKPEALDGTWKLPPLQRVQ